MEITEAITQINETFNAQYGPDVLKVSSMYLSELLENWAFMSLK